MQSDGNKKSTYQAMAWAVRPVDIVRYIGCDLASFCTHNLLSNKPYEPFFGDKAFKNIQGNNSINTEGRQYREFLSSDEGISMDTHLV